MWRRYVFGKYSEGILGAYSMYGKRSENMRNLLVHSEWTFAVFWKHSGSIRKAIGKESFRSQHAGSIRSILKPYWKHSENKRISFGDTLRKTHSEGHYRHSEILQRHSESVRKGFVMFYVHSGCSESIRNILCILEVNEQFGKCSERMLEGFWLFVIHSAA